MMCQISIRSDYSFSVYKSSEIYDLEKQESPGTAVVNDWIQKQNPTLEMLIKKLDEIERKDMIDELEKVTNYKHPSLDPPTVEERKYTYERNEVERSIETDEQTSLKMGQNEFIKVPYDAYSNWQQKQKEGLDAIMRIEKDSDKTMERMGNDTGYNTSASSSERFDSDRNDSSMESKISDSSLEMDGPISMSINIDGANYPGMKLRYTPTNSGRLAINAVDSDDRNEILLDGERSSFMNQNQRVIRQESIETCRNPIQTEPSLNSNQFIDLKEERLTQVVRPKRPSLKVTIPLVAPEAEQVPHSQQQVVSLESYVKLHTQDAPTLHDMSSAQNTPEDIRDRTMSSQSGISDTCEFNSARSENETPLTSESGFHHLDLSSITSENSELFGHGNIDNSESSRDHYLEPAAMRDVLGIASQSLRENLNTGLDMEAASCSIASAATNSTRSLHRNEDEFSVSTTDSSVSGNSGSITDLKRRQIEADFSNVGNDNSGELASGTNEGRENIPRQSRSGSLTSLGLGDVASGTNEGRGSDIPQSRSLPTLTSLGIGIAAGILIVTAYNKFK